MRQQKIKFICFDMDGVLFSAENIIANAYREGVLEYNKAYNKKLLAPSTERIMQEVGKPVPQIFANLFPLISTEQQKILSDISLQKLLQLVQNKEGTLLPNVKETLRYLKQKKIKTGIASNGRRPYIQKIIDTYALSPLITHTHCIGEFFGYRTLTTKSSLIQAYAQKFLLKPQEVLMVGDRMVDYQAAQKANCNFLGVLSGHGTELDSILQLKDSVRDLANIKKLLL